VPPAAQERRRLAVLDGGDRFDLVVSEDASVADILAGAGIRETDGVLGIMTGHGALLSLDGDAHAVQDGDVLVLVQAAPEERPYGNGTVTPEVRESVSPLWWLLALTGLLSSAAGLTLGDQTSASAVLFPLPALMACASVTAMLIWARRLPHQGAHGITAVAGPLLMAFAAGCLATPHFPDRAVQLPVLAGLTAVTAVAALSAHLTHNLMAKACLGTTVVVLAVSALLWFATFLLVLPASAAAVISVAAAPVMLNALPSFLLNVSPGHLVDMRRFMLLRWTVRQDVPAGEKPVHGHEVRPLVDESSARLVTATVLVCLLAAMSVLMAAPASDASLLETVTWDILVPSVTVALLLGSRKAFHPVLRWAPRGTAVVVIAVGLPTFLRQSPSGALVLVALLVLLGALGVVALLVPIHRGLKSLFWSRAGDIVETLSTILCFPAGLLAVGTIDLVRGMMA